MNDPKAVRTVVMHTLRAFFDRAVESFREAPDGDHFFETLQATVVALQYATRITDELLAEIVAGVEPRYYVRALCLHKEQQKHIGRWEE